MAGVLVVVDAVKVQGAQFGSAPPDAGPKLDRSADSGAGQGVEQGQVARREQLGHHEFGQGTAHGVVGPGTAGTLALPDSDVARSPGEGPARLAKPHLPAVPQEPRNQVDRCTASRS